ncbi:Piwi domain-containing protein [Stachybotrys elegans]|uniref:Piwi domain-containing protein n=1 Tax=Stachybotrys elegans TaxID=80388 RepID=A0A8K0WSY3_9HYPO|nr:Piwi domain-containing protein [Stachybotrys elegans]
MEFAYIEPMQRYAFKLTPDQTAAMIKIAVTRPPVRRADIERNVRDLQLDQDPFLRHYGVKFEPQFAQTEARVIAPPKVNFLQGFADPRFSGRWDLRGKKFWKPNQQPLVSWGFIVMDKCVNKPALEQFAKAFKTTFIGHGGVVPGDPVFVELRPEDTDAAKAVTHGHNTITQKQNHYTQLLFIVVPQRNSPYYERLKKSADCRWGILSQVVNSAAVVQNNGQYHSNVCMKVNAKLGGATSRTLPPWKISQPRASYFPPDRPTVMMGVDISHAAPGGGTPSFAAMTMSVDPDATRYAAWTETNGYRVEMLTPKNVHTMFGGLIDMWRVGHGGKPPVHIIYMRDGVAEGQFAHVIDQEVGVMKQWLGKNLPAKFPQPKFTVIIATKRHHIRFFPAKGDRNGNPLPGTLVEREVTHPFMNDFYLNSHVAIQGTARPVHYHVLLDEMGLSVNELQKMIYHQCYSYARSTTPVSLHPAVYYAHLASNRCRAHETVASSDGYVGAKAHEITRDRIAKGKSTTVPERDAEAPPLLALGGKPETPKPSTQELQQRNFIKSTMWYI